MKNFVRSNMAFIVWLVLCMSFYFLLFHGAMNVFLVIVIVHLISLTIAFSPLGEWAMRLIDGVRKIEIYGEVSYIYPLFTEVYYEAAKHNPKLSQKIEVFIKDEAAINAYTYGSNTIIITRGALESLGEDQMKGLIAHEFGHLANGDTRIKLALTIGGGFFSIFYVVLNGIIRLLNFFIRVFYFKTLLSLYNLLFVYPLRFIRFVLVKTIWLFQTASALLIGLGSRNNQYRADEFACTAGYKEHLLSSLYALHEMNIIGSASLMEHLKSGSPHIASRIARLERMN